jgi:hypothetical protein
MVVRQERGASLDCWLRDGLELLAGVSHGKQLGMTRDPTVFLRHFLTDSYSREHPLLTVNRRAR